MTMTALYFVGLAWSVLQILLGIVIGLSIRDADRREQPDLDDDTAEIIYVPREWVA